MNGTALIAEGSAEFLEFVTQQQCKASLSFRRDGPILRVEGSGCIGLFHGARAYFDGDYARVGHVSRVERLAGMGQGTGAPVKVQPRDARGRRLR